MLTIRRHGGMSRCLILYESLRLKQRPVLSAVMAVLYKILLDGPPRLRTIATVTLPLLGHNNE